MTLVSSIIADAYRESNIIPMGVSPNSNQSTEALGRLNPFIMSVLGNEVGDSLNDLNIGGTYDQTSWCSPYVPDDARLVLNLSAATSFMLDYQPYEGQRLSFVDAAGNLATHNLTLNGNGRTIEGSATITLSTNGDSRQWFYRADLGDWVKVNTLLTSDELPFPTEFDDFFITMLAMRLNPRYGQTLPQETVEALKRMRSQIRSRYHNYRQVRPDLNTRGYLSDPNSTYSYSNPNEFSIGRPFPWR